MIEVMELTKDFGARRAVDHLSFTVEKGEILGFLGPNGAGKSTTMRMITGFIPPTGGTARIGGFDITEAPIEARKRMGYLPENAPVYADMTVADFLGFCADVRGFSGGERGRRVEEALEKCFLREVRFQPVNTLSKGFKQRVCFAQSILHTPEYLIMDEPTDGLDPNQKHEVRLMIREMSRERAIILSTHILDEVEAVCTRAIIISGGRIIADDTPEGLRTRSSLHGAVSVTVTGNADGNGILNCLETVPGVRSASIVAQGDASVQLSVLPQSPSLSLAEKVLAALTQNEYQVSAIFVEKGRLDEVFRTLTRP